jgi:O-antigen ligase
MIAYRIHNKRITQIGVAIMAGFLLGLASTMLDPLWVLVGITTLACFFIFIKRPEVGLLGYLVITSTIINGDSLPRISIGVGKILITDIILLTLLSFIIIRVLVEHDCKIVHTPLDLPLISFLGVAFLSTFIAINQSRLTINGSLGETRVFVSYLTFFVVTNLVRDERRLRSLIRILFCLATIVAVAMIAQFLLGNHVQILSGRVETLGTEGVSVMGVTRIIPPGESLVFIAFLAITVTLIIAKLGFKNLPAILIWVLTGIGVILTFKRNLWIAVFLAFLLLMLLSRWETRLRMAGGILAIIFMATILLLTILSQSVSETNKLVTGTLDRLFSLANPRTFEDPNSSLRWRDFEYQYAIPQIISHPLIGLGLGAIYRPFVIKKDGEGFDGRKYTHNGHLYIIVKSGLLGYTCFVVLSLLALARGFKFWRKIPNLQFRAVLLGFTLAYLGILIGSIVSPMIVTAWWTPVIGVLLGVNEVILAGAISGWN